MDVKRSINTKIWSDPWVETLSPEKKLLWIYLLTNRDTNMLGIYEISMKRISYETGISEAHIKEYFTEFETLSKAFVWFGRVYLPNWMKNQAMNTNMTKCAKALFERLPKELIDKLKERNIESFESLSNGCQTLPEIEIEI